MDLFEPDKLVHLFMFAVLVVLMMRGFSLYEPRTFVHRHLVFLSLNIAILLSALTELMQRYFIPGRVCSVYDFIANVIGCFLGWWVFIKWAKRVNN